MGVCHTLLVCDKKLLRIFQQGSASILGKGIETGRTQLCCVATFSYIEMCFLETKINLADWLLYNVVIFFVMIIFVIKCLILLFLIKTQ